jgi:spore germination cell wall hydrolase CwlJ-like protein
MDDSAALALCAFLEANLEPDDGLAAVCRVVLNRTRLRYQSNGTIRSTIFWPNSFSWTAWDMVEGRYAKVAFTPGEVAARAAGLLARAKAYPRAWARAGRISQAVLGGSYAGPEYAAMTDDVVLYFNPAVVNPPPG